jgi:hypothetical protein
VHNIPNEMVARDRIRESPTCVLLVHDPAIERSFWEMRPSNERAIRNISGGLVSQPPLVVLNELRYICEMVWVRKSHPSRPVPFLLISGGLTRRVCDLGHAWSRLPDVNQILDPYPMCLVDQARRLVYIPSFRFLPLTSATKGVPDAPTQPPRLATARSPRQVLT